MLGEEGIQKIEHTSPFDVIRQVREDGYEFWSARDIARLLDYKKWDKFLLVIERVKKALENSGEVVSDHVLQSGKLIKAGKGAKREIDDFRLSRHACYLLVENADPDKPIVALGQAYFAYQTRLKELADSNELAALPEDQKRLILRSEMTIFNKRLAEAAQGAGVVRPEDFQVFTDMGYIGLYGGERENDIHGRKGLRAGEKVLDFMDSEELGMNIFRVTQTDAKIRREQIQTKEEANNTHYRMGRRVREFVLEEGGVPPEQIQTPAKSIKDLQREEQKRLVHHHQPTLFDTLIDGTSKDA